jgi:hypothetical protein
LKSAVKRVIALAYLTFLPLTYFFTLINIIHCFTIRLDAALFLLAAGKNSFAALKGRLTVKNKAASTCIIRVQNKDFRLKSKDVAVKSLDFELKSLDLGVKSLDVALKSLDLDLKSLDVDLKSKDVAVKSLDFGLKSLDFELKSLDIKVKV